MDDNLYGYGWPRWIHVFTPILLAILIINAFGLYAAIVGFKPVQVILLIVSSALIVISNQKLFFFTFNRFRFRGKTNLKGTLRDNTPRFGRIVRWGTWSRDDGVWESLTNSSRADKIRRIMERKLKVMNYGALYVEVNFYGHKARNFRIWFTDDAAAIAFKFRNMDDMEILDNS